VGQAWLHPVPRAVPETPLVCERSIPAGRAIREGNALSDLNRRGTRGEVYGGDDEENIAIYVVWSRVVVRNRGILDIFLKPILGHEVVSARACVIDAETKIVAKARVFRYVVAVRVIRKQNATR